MPMDKYLSVFTQTTTNFAHLLKTSLTTKPTDKLITDVFYAIQLYMGWIQNWTNPILAEDQCNEIEKELINLHKRRVIIKPEAEASSRLVLNIALAIRKTLIIKSQENINYTNQSYAFDLGNGSKIHHLRVRFFNHIRKTLTTL